MTTTAETHPATGTAKVPLRRRLGYASTDMAGNLLYTTVSTFVLYYYTDVFGLSVAAAGSILLIARILDAFDAPVWGFIIDHTNTRWGQSRPWWLFASVPFALFLVMMFWSPDLSSSGKYVWALVSYLLFGIAYTGISTPITAILPNLSNDSGERITLNSFRMIGGMVGYFITATFTLSIVAWFGGGDEQAGWRWTAIAFAVVGLALLLFAFFNTKELNRDRVRSLPIKESIRAARNNWPWVVLVVAFVFYWLGNASRTSVLIYYTEYNLGHREWASVLNGLVMFQIVGMLAIPYLVKVLAKWQTLVLGFALAALGQAVLPLVDGSLLGLSVAWSVASVGTGIAVSMPFAMLSDTVDYGEWRNGVRAAGFLTAIGSSFAIKLGSGIGGWVPSVILGNAGYVANQEQTPAVQDAIQFSVSLLPAIFFAIGALVVLAYRRYERQEESVRSALGSRREPVAS
ncbi:glycoside-pentoside-hexuronide (GPH):cation symporter [Isoptericola sp. NPDC019693]|uniref:glycoside-pentoside-hexuronide (GPH):cation symporter n=1 Tax=Isoptericola sp. NPDC019693 TaxID=3364009 RepID=UPI00378F6C95